MKRILLLMLVCTLCACVDNGKEDPKQKNRTLILYIAADNNLYSKLVEDLNEMERVWSDDFDGTVLVYLSPRSASIPAKLYKIRRGETSQIESEVVKTYPLKQNACDPLVLSQVIADSRELAPAKSYALMLSSHATGWVPKGMPPLRSNSGDGAVSDYTFGVSDTHGDKMEIYDLAKALPTDIMFDFIGFDACYMASVEVAYQLRNRTRYFVGSSTETMDVGFPYDLILPNMMSVEADLKSVARKTVDFFRAQSGFSQSSTMSVTDCSKLPAVAAALKEITTMDPNARLASLIQNFDVNNFVGFNLFYDLGDLVNKTWANSPALAKFNAALKDAVIFVDNTPLIFSKPVTTNCGLTVYAPRKVQAATLEIYRTNYDWAADSGMAQIEF